MGRGGPAHGLEMSGRVSHYRRRAARRAPRARRRSRPPRRAPSSTARAPAPPAPAPRARRSSAGRASQPLMRSAIASHRIVGPTSKERSAGVLGHRLGELARDLPHPGVVGRDRRHSAGGGLGGDHPEGLGEDARHHQRLRGRHHLGDLGVLQPAADRDRARGVLAEARDLRLRAPLAGRRSPPAAGARPGCRRQHRGPGRDQQVHALVPDQLADEQHARRSLDPLGQRLRGRGPVAAEAVVGRPRPRCRPASSLTRRQRLGLRRWGGTRAVSTPGGPSRVRSGSSGSPTVVPQVLGRVAGADQQARRPRRCPRGRRGRSGRGAAAPRRRDPSRAP